LQKRYCFKSIAEKLQKKLSFISISSSESDLQQGNSILNDYAD